jgi:aquaporin Z
MAYGAALAALMLAAPTSAGFNPALAVAEYLVGDRERLSGFLPYRIAAQLAGAVVGALLAAFAVRCFGVPIADALPAEDLFCTSFLAGIGALAMAFVYLNTSAAGSEPLRAAATGTMAFAAAAVVENRTTPVFNPAVYLGLTLSGNLAWNTFWAATVATLIGAAAGASLFLLARGRTE